MFLNGPAFVTCGNDWPSIRAQPYRLQQRSGSVSGHDFSRAAQIGIMRALAPEVRFFCHSLALIRSETAAKSRTSAAKE